MIRKYLVYVILAMFLIATPVFSQVWYTANQKTVKWTATTELEDGSPIPPDSTIKYQPYIKLSTAPEGTPYEGEITGTSKTFTFTVEGKYFVGFKSVRYVGSEKVSESTIAWSDVPVNCAGGVAFGIAYYQSPKLPGGLEQEK